MTHPFYHNSTAANHKFVEYGLDVAIHYQAIAQLRLFKYMIRAYLSILIPLITTVDDIGLPYVDLHDTELRLERNVISIKFGIDRKSVV